MSTLFYSWQSDNKKASGIIKQALIKALQSVNTNLTESDRPEEMILDQDTKNVPGAVDIIETIFGKIDKADVFLADVTPITTVGRKAIPNPNVMTELGYAIRSVTYARCIFVALVEDKNTKMPFDIQGKRLLLFKADEKEEALVEKLSESIRLCLPVAKDRAETPTLITVKEQIMEWANWSNLRPSFRADVTIDNYQNPKPNFVEKVVLRGTDGDSSAWVSEIFVINRERQGARLRVEPHDKVDIEVFVSTHKSIDAIANQRVAMPDLDRNDITLEFDLADGSHISQKVKIREH